MLIFKVIVRVLIFIISLMCILEQAMLLSLIVFPLVTAMCLLFRIIMLIFSICVTRWKLNLRRCRLVFAVNLIMILINMSLNTEAKTGLLLLVLLLVIVAYLVLVKISRRRKR